MLYLLKLGGSLITEKDRAHTARPATLARLAEEIAQAYRQQPDLQLVIGHGSGSFGHVAGKKHGTRRGVQTPEAWLGFAEVWQAARALNQIVVEALLAAGLPLIAFPPSAGALADGGKTVSWDLAPMQAALRAHLVPLVNGDTIFDRSLGGTILSTEELFFYLAPRLGADRILLAGLETGVWSDYPARRHLIGAITPENYPAVERHLGDSAATDVTGGMAEKVNAMLRLVEQSQRLEVLIFSGEEPGAVLHALSGGSPGTRICKAYDGANGARETI